MNNLKLDFEIALRKRYIREYAALCAAIANNAINEMGVGALVDLKRKYFNTYDSWLAFVGPEAVIKLEIDWRAN